MILKSYSTNGRLPRAANTSPYPGTQQRETACAAKFTVYRQTGAGGAAATRISPATISRARSPRSTICGKT